MSRKSQELHEKWTGSSRSYFERFAAELEEYTKSGCLPSGGDQDVRYGLELQQKRLQEKGLDLEYEFQPRGHFAAGGGPVLTWSDRRYVNRTECRTCRLTRRMLKDGRRIYEKSQNEIFYQIITSAANGEAVAEEPYGCPNCGAVSKVKELQNGCPYCRTFFKMSDLFPKVTNYFFVKDAGGTGGEIKQEMLRSVIPCFFVAALGYIWYFYSEGTNLLLALIQGTFAGVVLGGIGGYMIWAFSRLGGLFLEAGKALGPLFNAAGSRRQFMNLMRQHSPEFSYEYFSGKVASILKMMIFSEDATRLPNYTGGPIGNLFKDIVDASSYGAVALKQCRVSGYFVYVVVEAYMVDWYEKNGRVRRKTDKFRMHLYKRIDRAIDYNFSIRKIQCRDCGASFDATKSNICPSCGRRYAVEDSAWIVTDIRKA